MKENKTFEQRLNGAYAPHEPNPELKQKALNLRPNNSRRPIWLAFGAVGFAGAAVLAFVFALPATSLAQAVIKQASAFEGHLLTYNILPDGRWQKTGEQWTQGGKLRVIDLGAPPSEYLFDPDRGIGVSLNGGMGTITVRNLKVHDQKSPGLLNVLTQQNLKEFLARRGIHQTPRIERTQFNGRPADCVELSMGPVFSDKLYADPVTHRMLGWSYRNSKVWPNNPPENNYTHVYVVDPRPAPLHIFDPIFNIDGVPTDVLGDKEKWRDRLSKPLQVFTFNLVPRPSPNSKAMKAGIRTVAVRNLTVNRAGDVFVLFTGVHGDYGTNVVPTAIHDTTGGRYVKAGSFLPSAWGEQSREYFSYNGVPLDGAWFVRLGGGALKGPISVGFKQEFENKNSFTFTYKGDPERIDREIPAYMPYMYLPIGNRTKWLQMRIDQLANARDQAKEYVGEERLIRQIIELNKSKVDGDFYMPADLDCRLAETMEKQGKRADAHATFEKAQAELAAQKFDPGPWLKKRIDAGLGRLNH